MTSNTKAVSNYHRSMRHSYKTIILDLQDGESIVYSKMNMMDDHRYEAKVTKIADSSYIVNYLQSYHDPEHVPAEHFIQAARIFYDFVLKIREETAGAYTI